MDYMYESYSSQVLPDKEYRALLGSALCVFNSNNQFIIEKVLKIDSSAHDWYELTDDTSGQLLSKVEKIIGDKSSSEISKLYHHLTLKRNRIVHSFLSTVGNTQILRTKDKEHNQFDITNKYLLEFISENNRLSTMLYNLKNST